MFTSEEIEILFSALEAWENEEVSKSMLGSMLAAALIRDESRAKSAVDDMISEGKEKTRGRKEQAILLKAKLLHMRDAAFAEDVSQALRK